MDKLNPKTYLATQKILLVNPGIAILDFLYWNSINLCVWHHSQFQRSDLQGKENEPIWPDLDFVLWC